MSLVARAVAYVSALLIAFGAVLPWVRVDGEPIVVAPALAAIVCGFALAVTVATALRQRVVLGVFAVLIGGFAVYALWVAPGNAIAGGAGEATAGGGLTVIMSAAALLYLASWLPAPRARPALPVDAEG